MFEMTLRKSADARRLAWLSGRSVLRWGGVAADTVAMAGAFLVAALVQMYVSSAAEATALSGLVPPLWMAVFAAAVLMVFHVAGLYDLEVYVSRPLHLWTLAKASLIALGLTAVALFGLGAHAFDAHRIGLLSAFVLFLAFTGLLRLAVLDGAYTAWARAHDHATFLVGDPVAAAVLAKRLCLLRGFGQVERVDAGANAADSLANLLTCLRSIGSRTASVFIDGASLTPRQVYETAAAAQGGGAEVYVASGLLESLESNHLLRTLFGTPLVRLRGREGDVTPYRAKRVLDIVGSAALISICLPVLAVLGVIIRATSPGPVFYRQTRVGMGGTPFEFLKLRSMVVNHDASVHSEYVHDFMHGTADTVSTGTNGDRIYKKVDDPRITPIGRFVRKYSLDEIPQFWNVLRGDMSLVGPRPPLPYEVAEYDLWDRLRLRVPAGVTGVWQVSGRSRVSFDEMVLQDLMYSQNARLLIDVMICLKTVPAALFGGGGG